uniref:RING-type domain-containing protein n=1 Tax=Globodera rostochiensis TaxID=31243 RepID=A0A914HJV0_GLORO
MLLLLVSAVILLVIVLAAPSSQTTTDDETDSSANSETDVIATNAQIQDCLLLWNGANSDELASAEFVSIGVLPVLVNCLKSTELPVHLRALLVVKHIAVVEAGAEPLLVKRLKSPEFGSVQMILSMSLAKFLGADNAREKQNWLKLEAVPLLVKRLHRAGHGFLWFLRLAFPKLFYPSELLSLPVIDRLHIYPYDPNDCPRPLANVPLCLPAPQRSVLQKLMFHLTCPVHWMLVSENKPFPECWSESSAQPLTKQIAWALTNITDASDDLALAVVEAGALPLLVKLLQSPDMDLCESTAWTLKNIAAASDDLALAVIEAGALPPLVELLQSQNQEAYEEASWAIGNIIEKIPDLNGCCIDAGHIQIMARLQKIEQLKTKKSEFVLKMIEKIHSSKGCVVCFDKKIDFVFIPCWHACVCEECEEKIGDTCPMCRQISSKQRIYLP